MATIRRHLLVLHTDALLTGIVVTFVGIHMRTFWFGIDDSTPRSCNPGFRVPLPCVTMYAIHVVLAVLKWPAASLLQRVCSASGGV
jgi:hypothetical protein